MSDALLLHDVVEDLCFKGRIAAADVLVLRRELYRDGVCSDEEAESVFRLDQACREKDPAWTRFYVDALTDYFVWQAHPRGYVSEQQGRMLVERITRDGRIEALSELELLVNVVHRATHCPEDVVLLVLRAVYESIVSPPTAAYGSNRPPAVITAADAAIVRKVIHAPGGDGSITVTRREAELILDLNDAARGEDNAPEWRDLYVKAIACHLMSPIAAPRVPSAAEELRREAWLGEREGIGHTLRSVGRAFAHADIPFAEAWRALDPGGYQSAREEAEAEDRRVRAALAREAITADEAGWLVARLGDRPLDDNERALMAFIRDNAASIDPALRPLMARAGV